MAVLADLRPGARIYNANDDRGTFTCFAIKPATRHKLYGITARHCLPAGQYCFLGDLSDGNRLIIGGPAKPAATLDVTHFRIEDDVKRQLTASNFLPVGYTADITDVWDPRLIRHKVDHVVKTAAEESALKAKLMPVRHFGATTLVPPGGAVAGDIAKWSATATSRIQNTTIARGDSGGPIIDGGKNRWVGFVSSGLSAQASTGGGIVLLRDAFEVLGLALASWHNRGHWQ
jgi:hypothetical protein